MAASTGKTGKGVVFKMGDGASPEVFAAVGNARSINPTGQSADEIDFTHLGSTGGYREFRQGFKDAGSINVDYQFDPTDATHIGEAGLLGKFNSGAVFSWQIDFAPAGWPWRLVGQGFVSNPGDIDINVDGPITGSATIRRTGATTLEASP